MRFQILASLLYALPLIATGRETPATVDLSERTGIAFSEATAPPSIVNLASVDSAVRLAILYNPRTRVLLAEAALARAERSEGRKLPNPEADFAFRKKGSESHWELSILGDVNGLLLYPWKRGATNTRYKAALSKLAAEVSGHKLEVQTAFYRALAAGQVRNFIANSAATWEAAAELSRRQRAAGTMNALDLAETEAAAVEARLELRQAEAKFEEEKEGLGRLLGLSPSNWTLPDSLPVPPAEDPALSKLEAIAATENIDLAVAREESAAADRAQTLASLEILPSLKAGLSIERDDAGRQFIGPAIAAEIPLFDLGFARRAHARAEGDLTRKRMMVVESGLRSQIKTHYMALVVARRNHEEASGVLVPFRETASAEALKQYNFMLAGVYRLLEARREELAARVLSVEALRDYWIARSELERRAGSLPFKDTRPELKSPRSSGPEGEPIPTEPVPSHNHDHGDEK